MSSSNPALAASHPALVGVDLSELRSAQHPPVHHVLEGKGDAWLDMPAAGGKSIAMLLPALRPAPGAWVTLFVCLRIARAQELLELVERLAHPAHPAARYVLHSRVGWPEKHAALEHALRGPGPEPVLLFVTTETLFMSDVLGDIEDISRKGALRRVVVDDGDTIIRGSRYRLGTLRLPELRARAPGVPLTLASRGLSSTDRERLLPYLGMAPETTHAFRSPLAYPNLTLRVVATHCSGIPHKMPVLTEVLKRHAGQQGLVVCNVRGHVDKVTEALAEAPGVPSALPASGEMDPDKRSLNVEAWRSGKVRLLVCTAGIGLGRVKADVDFVVVYDTPKSIEDLRDAMAVAGRDGRPAEVLTLFSWRDIQRGIHYNVTPGPAGSLHSLQDYLDKQYAAVRFLSDCTRCRHVALREHFESPEPSEPECTQGRPRCDNCEAGNKPSSTVPIRPVADELLNVVQGLASVEGDLCNVDYFTKLFRQSQDVKLLNEKNVPKAVLTRFREIRNGAQNIPAAHVVEAILAHLLSFDVLRGEAKESEDRSTILWNQSVKFKVGPVTLASIPQELESSSTARLCMSPSARRKTQGKRKRQHSKKGKGLGDSGSSDWGFSESDDDHAERAKRSGPRSSSPGFSSSDRLLRGGRSRDLRAAGPSGPKPEVPLAQRESAAIAEAMENHGWDVGGKLSRGLIEKLVKLGSKGLEDMAKLMIA